MHVFHLRQATTKPFNLGSLELINRGIIDQLAQVVLSGTTFCVRVSSQLGAFFIRALTHSCGVEVSPLHSVRVTKLAYAY